jgi:hypothetical protein
MPILMAMPNNRWRLFFSGRDALNRSRGFVAELDLSVGVRVVEVAAAPVLAPGERGTFDADGAMPSSIVTIGDEIWLYYRLDGKARPAVPDRSRPRHIH